MMLQQLSSGLGDHDVVIPFEGVLGDRVVSRVGGKDCEVQKSKVRERGRGASGEWRNRMACRRRVSVSEPIQRSTKKT
jgi:hypothetical protein